MTDSDAPYELPDGWMWTTIGETCAVNPTMQWPEGFAKNKPVHFVPMSAVDGETGAIVTPEPRPISEVWKGYKRFQDGDVIFARITPCMENGKAAIAKNLLNGIGLGSTEYHVLRPSEKVLAEWIYHFVRQPSFRNDAARAMTGTAGQLRVPADFVTQTSIPLPPLPEQRRIVARIKSLFAESRTARDALERVPALLKRFRQSVLASAFRGRLTSQISEVSKTSEVSDADAALPVGWAWVTVRDVAQSIQYGYTATSSHEFNGPRYLRITDIQSGKVDWSSVPRCEIAKEDVPKYLLKPGDIVFARSGATAGKSFLIKECPESVFASYLIRVQTSPAVLPDYLYAFFNSKDYWDNLTTRGNAQPNANAQVLGNVTFPLAPLAEQRRIVAKIESLFAQADAIERAVAIAQKRADKIDQSILARAFRGELT